MAFLLVNTRMMLDYDFTDCPFPVLLTNQNTASSGHFGLRHAVPDFQGAPCTSHYYKLPLLPRKTILFDIAIHILVIK